MMAIYQETGVHELGNGRYLASNFQELPIFSVSPDHMEYCEKHGEWCVAAYWDISEISSMIANGEMLCPFCMDSICSH